MGGCWRPCGNCDDQFFWFLFILFCIFQFIEFHLRGSQLASELITSLSNFLQHHQRFFNLAFAARCIRSNRCRNSFSLSQSPPHASCCACVHCRWSMVVVPCIYIAFKFALFYRSAHFVFVSGNLCSHNINSRSNSAAIARFVFVAAVFACCSGCQSTT